MSDLTPFQRGYFTCLLWSSTDESRDDGGDPLDANYTIDDIDPESLAWHKQVCDAFESAYKDDLFDGEPTHSPEWSDAEKAGHDLWLTRNRHGAGFWDGDWLEPYATHLTDAAHKLGECNPYVGDDGRIYID